MAQAWFDNPNELFKKDKIQVFWPNNTQSDNERINATTRFVLYLGCIIYLIKRDVRIFAKRYPAEFMESLNDPLLRLQNKCAKFFSENLLVLKNKKDVYYNIQGNKNKLLTVPYGEDPLFILASFLQSDEGLEVLRILEGKLG